MYIYIQHLSVFFASLYLNWVWEVQQTIKKQYDIKMCTKSNFLILASLKLVNNLSILCPVTEEHSETDQNE